MRHAHPTALQLVRQAAVGEALTPDQGRRRVDVIVRYTPFVIPAKAGIQLTSAK
jgi:hypothetical protein